MAGRLSKNATRKHTTVLRKLAELETLQPNRRLMAEMLLLTLEGIIPEVWFESIYGGKNRQSPEQEDVEVKITEEAKTDLANLKSMLGEVDGTSNSAS